jgi:peptidoglycan/LPS O-acetylase OafA/YrhL
MWSGVDLFFVLSGFLIGGILLDSKNSPTYFPTFYLRRIYRIFQLYYLMISLLMIGSLLFPSSYLFVSQMPKWPFLFFAQNIFGIAHSPLLVGVTWSLAVEEQFYLLLPFAVRRLSRRAMLILAIVCIVGAPILRTILFHWGVSWDLIRAPLPCRADALALGVLTAILVRNEAATMWVRQNIKAGYFYFAILLCCALATLKFQETRYTETIVISLLDQMYFCLLVLLLLSPLRAMTWIFRSKWLGWLGKVSYCTYLIHWPIWYSIFRIAGYREPAITNFFSFSVAILAAFVVFSVAQLSWTYLEHPINQRAHRLYNY